jgi:hypothetical protein
VDCKFRPRGARTGMGPARHHDREDDDADAIHHS